MASLVYVGFVASGTGGHAPRPMPVRVLKVVPALLLAVVLAPVSPFAAAGMVASAAGDAFLLDKARFFLHGLGAFLLGHLLFVGAFLSASEAWPSPGVIGVLAVLAASVTAAVRPRSGTMRVAIPVYALGLSAMVAAATTLGPLGVVGGVSFLVSDLLLAVHQFKRPVPGRDVLVSTTYYGALLALSAAVIGA